MPPYLDETISAVSNAGETPPMTVKGFRLKHMKYISGRTTNACTVTLRRARNKQSTLAMCLKERPQDFKISSLMCSALSLNRKKHF